MAMSHSVEGSFRLGDVFSKSFGVFGRHFLAFFVLTLIAYVPSYLFGWPTALSPALALNVTLDAWGLLVVPVGIGCGTIANGAMTYGVVQDLRGGTVSIGEAITVAARRFLPMIGVALSASVLATLGFVLLIVPGFMIMCAFFVAAPVCIAEKAGIRASLSRSRSLTRGHRWQIFGALILILIIGGIVGGIAGSIADFAGPVGSTIVSYGAQAVFGAFSSVVAAVFYYQLRVAKDGIDLAKIASVFD
jgi:hypothetical protein